jgi:hypothetical protein
VRERGIGVGQRIVQPLELGLTHLVDEGGNVILTPSCYFVGSLMKIIHRNA